MTRTPERPAGTETIRGSLSERRPLRSDGASSLRFPLFAAAAALAGISACQGCGAASSPAAAPPAPERTVRLYALSAPAGALEPCGCTKDQMGGLDHLAAYLAAESQTAPASLVVAAGPTFFGSVTLKPDKASQDLWKAEAIAASLRDLRLAAFAPGANDWAAGPEALERLRAASGGAMLAANLRGATGAGDVVVREVSGVQVGLLGLAAPRVGGAPPPGVAITPPEEALREAIARARAGGARVLVALAALPRGEALRLVDAAPELHVVVVGKPAQETEANEAAKAPTLVGETLVVEGANHVQTVAVIDLHVREDGAVRFQDASGLARAEEAAALERRIAELEQRIAAWEKGGAVQAGDLAARRADLERLRGERRVLERPPPPAAGSFFRYAVTEVREKLGVDEGVAARMRDFYRRVNESNKVTFADRKPPPVEAGQAGYLGIDACTDCHDEERKVWNGTAHAIAYRTLVDQSKEYNLDCVGCHVTGYGRPGGSTVTHNEKLRDVQCEECHGPGSQHARWPERPGLILRSPTPESCISACHHSPHVENFDARAKMKLVLGPGHGD